MPGKFLLTLTFDKQGKVAGSSTKGRGQHGFSGGTLCHSFNFSVESQLDVGKGQVTGRRQHNPIVIVKEVDESTPLIFQALCTNEVLQSAVLTQQPTTPSTTQQPVTLTKQINSASPSLFQHAVTSPTFKRVQPKFGTPGKGQVPYHTIELTNGTILDIRPAGIIEGKRCEAVTVSYENLKVNGMLNGTIPRWLLG